MPKPYFAAMFSIDFSILRDSDLLALADEKLKVSTEEWERDIWQFIYKWFDTTVETIPVLSSGSTGAPKQWQHTKKAMLESAVATCYALQLKQNSNALLCLPAGKIGGMMMILRSISNRMKLYCIPPSVSVLKTLPDNIPFEFAAFTPMQFHDILQNEAAFARAEKIKKIILGGEEVRKEMRDRIRQMQNETFSTFGMTETISHIALKRLNGKYPDRYFKTLPGISVSADLNNCLIIEAPFLGQPHLLTNDVVEIIHNNEFGWIGRIDNTVNSGGIKIHAEEIEKKLQAHISYPFFAAGIPDELTGERLILAIEATELTSVELDSVKKGMEAFDRLRRPKEILLITPFQRTGTGKIKRKETLQKKEVKRIPL